MGLPFLFVADRFGPTVTAAQARHMPEFLRGGRAAFFEGSPLTFWLFAVRSDLLPNFFYASGMFIAASIPMIAGLFLPALRAAPTWFPMAARVSPAAGILSRTSLAGRALFAGAHALLFRLHLPSRYTMFSLRVALAVAGGVACAIALDAVGRRLLREDRPVRRGLVAAAVLGVAGFVLAPILRDPAGHYLEGRYPEVYRFLAAQSENARIASLSREVDNIPAFSGRSVLVGRLAAVPYQLGYYRPLRRKAIDLLAAEYGFVPPV
jgi:hypothetical protein